MKPYFSDQIVVALAAIACLCVLIFLGLSLSPAFAATLSRGANFSVTLSALRSLIYPLCAIKSWPLFFGNNRACRWIESFACFVHWKEIA
jgi:predicted permease